MPADHQEKERVDRQGKGSSEGQITRAGRHLITDKAQEINKRAAIIIDNLACTG